MFLHWPFIVFLVFELTTDVKLNVFVILSCFIIFTIIGTMFSWSHKQTLASKCQALFTDIIVSVQRYRLRLILYDRKPEQNKTIMYLILRSKHWGMDFKRWWFFLFTMFGNSHLHSKYRDTAYAATCCQWWGNKGLSEYKYQHNLLQTIRQEKNYKELVTNTSEEIELTQSSHTILTWRHSGLQLQWPSCSHLSVFRRALLSQYLK